MVRKKVKVPVFGKATSIKDNVLGIFDSKQPKVKKVGEK